VEKNITYSILALKRDGGLEVKVGCKQVPIFSKVSVKSLLVKILYLNQRVSSFSKTQRSTVEFESSIVGTKL
jgi:hypothetical protein